MEDLPVVHTCSLLSPLADSLPTRLSLSLVLPPVEGDWKGTGGFLFSLRVGTGGGKREEKWNCSDPRKPLKILSSGQVV